MVKVNMHEAKSRLSELVVLVAQGEQVVIARNGDPVAELVPFTSTPTNRKGGQWKGKARIPADFDAPSKEIEDLFGV